MVLAAVALLVAVALYVWLDVFPLLGRLIVLRERRLDADLAAEQRRLAFEEQASRALRAANLPPDVEAHALSWGEAADDVRKRAQELFSEFRAAARDDDDAWARVRVALSVEELKVTS